MKKQWSMVGAIVLFLGISILSVLNVDPVPVNFGFAVVEWPLIVIIFVSVLLGALIATLLSTYKMFTDQRKSKHQESDSSSMTADAPSERRTRSGKKKTDTVQNDKVDAETRSDENDIL
ncbi:LapA family protein [Alkalibacterium sp. f15]|uniref:LapA family protein n=1 Tax=Alkalibacterium sp. f15 TaxID=3414029 RepID=UPI003BF8D130